MTAEHEVSLQPDCGWGGVTGGRGNKGERSYSRNVLHMYIMVGVLYKHYTHIKIAYTHTYKHLPYMQ